MFLAAQPCGQDGADRHGQIRERHDAEVPRPHTEDAETVYPLLVHYTVFYQYIPPLYAVTWVAFSFTELIVSISSLPVLPSNRRVNRMGWSKGGFIRTALLST